LTVSDVHGDVRRSLADDVARRKLDVDLILLLGDLANTPAFDSSSTPERTRKRLKDIVMLLRVLSRIESRHGIAFLLGNDDYRELAAEVARKDIQTRLKDEFNATSLNFEYDCISGYWFIGIGGSPETPWQTPYEFTEDQFCRESSELFARVKRLDSCARIVLASHCPSKGVLDVVHERDGKETHAGSEAILTLVKEHEPLLHVHGHVHGSFGTAMIGRTVVLNTACWYDGGDPYLGRHYGYIQLGKDNVTATLYKVGREEPLSTISSGNPQEH
jgi:Icc-related predicted phosphoesterase